MPSVSVKQGWPLLIVFLAIVLGIGSVVGLIAAPGDYVGKLHLPPVVLPPLVSGLLSVIMSVAFAVAGWRNWQINSNSTEMRLWLAALILSWWFPPALFIMRSPVLALAIIAIILVLMVWLAVRTRTRDRVSFWLFAPIVAYAAYVTAITGAIVAMNQGGPPPSLPA
jgi:tryptophan-rich sensory protein